MSINLNDTNPVAPLGAVNAAWQQDSSGNTSANVPFGAFVKTTVGSVAGVLTLDASVANSFLINVTEAITSMVINNPTDGEEITLLWFQDSTGWSVTVAANLLGPGTVSTGAGQQSCYRYTYNSGDNNFYQIGANGM